MKDWVLPYLRCPKCTTRLEDIAFEAKDKGGVRSGILICYNKDCQAWYPIIRGIPRMLPESLRAEMTKQFILKHQTALALRGLVDNSGNSGYTGKLHELKQHTIQNFGFEWLEYARYGWDDPTYKNIRQVEHVFRRKSLLQPEDIRDKLVLDAGCGNGRYSYWAAQYGGRVIGVDLGDGVEAASQNAADLPDVQILQGDIFNLPFADGCFDVIFSIGVLMHTGDARRGAMCLTSKLKPNGSLTVRVYGKGNLIYEFVDRVLRNRTTRMSLTELQEFTRKAYRLRQVVERMGLVGINRFVRLDANPHRIFDWYAAPIATHHTYAEVRGWFSDLGLKINETNENNPSNSLIKRTLRSLFGEPSTVTMRGIATIRRK